MGRRPGRERVLGPYRAGPGRWSVEHRTGTRSEAGGRSLHYFEIEEEALKFADELRRLVEHEAIGNNTIEEAIEKYAERHLKPKGNKANSVAMTVHRLKVFFRPVLSLRVDRLTPPRAARLYTALIDAKVMKPVKGAEPKEDGSIEHEEVPKYSPDTHRNMLAEAKSLILWCIEKKLTTRNALAAVKGQGRRNKGKPQLRVDEARKWLDTALAAGDAGAVAAMMTLLLGVRAHEVVERHVRDVDAKGTLLWIPSSKTDAGRRTLEIPELLRPLLLKLIEGRSGDEWLFPAESKSGRHWRDWPRKQVQRICALAGVPEVNAQGMRGTQASLAREHGATGHLVASALGHTSERMHELAYARPEAVQQGRQRAVLNILK
jgi:integrase